MSNAKHTPGPWTISAHDPCVINKLTPGTIEVRGERGGTETIAFIAECRDAATAKFIAAAPDMAEALKRVLYLTENKVSGQTEKCIRAALAKAGVA